jgi:hypothetical protein
MDFDELPEDVQQDIINDERKKVERYVNTEFTMVMSGEAFAQLMGILAEWKDDHGAENPDALAAIDTIKTRRTA